MSPADVALQALRPDFIQAMALCTGVFLLPLHHRPRWKLRYLAAVILCFGAGGLLSAGNHLIGSGQTAWPRWLSQGFQAVYFLLPLLAAYLIFRVCSGVDRADALYGTACVYAVQHTQFCLSIILGMGLRPVWNLAFNWLLLAAVLALSGRFLVRQLQQDGRYGVSRRKAWMMMGIMGIIGLLLNYPFRFLPGLRDGIAYPLGLTYDLCCCQFLLWLQLEQRRELRLAASAEAERRLRVQAQEQYRLSRETIAIINRKCHDLKHQVSALRLVTSPAQREQSLQELEQAAMIYDASVQTGNRVLDTVLTEKSLLCEHRSISWTCMAQGRLLDFVSPVDLYTLFGNALDNAIEASMALPVEERQVSVTVRRQTGGVLIQVENYFAGPLQMQNGLPRTTKQDAADHGYGLESIRRLAERYGGSADILARDGIFTLSVYLPLPDPGPGQHNS